MGFCCVGFCCVFFVVVVLYCFVCDFVVVFVVVYISVHVCFALFLFFYFFKKCFLGGVGFHTLSISTLHGADPNLIPLNLRVGFHFDVVKLLLFASKQNSNAAFHRCLGLL